MATAHYVICLVSMVMQGERVPECDFHVATVVGKKIVVFGGRSDVFAPYFTANDIYPNDFYYYELGKSESHTPVYCCMSSSILAYCMT